MIANPDQDEIDGVRSVLGCGRPKLRELQSIWSRRAPAALFEKVPTPSARAPTNSAKQVPWLQSGTELARAFVGHALSLGAFPLACDAAREALRLYSDAEIQRQLSVALLRLGSVEEARGLLQGILDRSGLSFSEASLVHCLIGDCFYYEALEAGEEDLRRENLSTALASYEAACAASPADYRCRSRAASVAYLLREFRGLGEDPGHVAAQLAGQCLDLIAIEESRNTESDAPLWLEKASALCVLGRLDEAQLALRAAAGHVSATPHVLARARDHARLLAKASGVDAAHFDACFPPLRLVVFSGHMPDAEGRPQARFPQAAEPEAREMIAAEIDSLAPCAGFSCAAAGADLMFLEELVRFRDRAAFAPECHVVLPWASDSFVESSVRPFGEHWVERFEQASSQADTVRVLGEAELPSDVAGFEYANVVLGGLAKMAARNQGLELVPVVFWNGESGKPGGTGSFVEFWRAQGVHVVHLSSLEVLSSYQKRVAKPASTVPRSSIVPSVAPASRRPSSATLGRQLKTMLFADVVGYSKLSEAVVPAYVEHFMGLVSRLVSESRYTPISVNTWGDAIYFVFDSAEAGGVFALDLLEQMARIDWVGAGVYWEDHSGDEPRRVPPSLRTALHTGPVYAHFDPIVRRLGFTGAHVSRAARIEPVTPHAKIFTSEEFAAVAAAEGVLDFTCDFVGSMPLAKNYPGDFRIYQLRRLRKLPLDLLARAIHEAYCREQVAKGESPSSNASLLPWSELSLDLKAENRAQAAAIKSKLFALGYELQPGPPGAEVVLELRPQQIERLAEQEHERWCESRRRRGWTFGHRRDEDKREHPSLVPWEDLPEAEKEKDREPVRNIPRLLRLAGFQPVRKKKNP